MLFRIRLEETRDRHDDQTLVRKFQHLNGHTFEADTLEAAHIELNKLGLSTDHGLGPEAGHWAYPTTEDQGHRVWFLSHGRTRIGNNAKLQQLRTPKPAK